jgi:CPA2 family monovalent cation:H+ antiporter-2
VAHEPVLISTLAVGLTLAFLLGLVARRIGLPTIVGYLAAGVVIGPFTPGFVADQAVAAELAEIGVILLMFGVGIHFSIQDLLAVRSISIPGAIVQMVVSAILGTAIGLALGWDTPGAVALGIALSIASTVVLTRALTERGELDTLTGHVAVGWLIVQDLVAVAALVLLPVVDEAVEGPTPGAPDPMIELALALGRAGVFGVLMVVVGVRVVPWLLAFTARQGSRELFTLAVLATALGIAFLASSVFGVSFALGAFLAGVVVGETDLSHQAAADALPLRDAFAVLFFVSVGMLVDPAYLVQQPLAILAVLAVVMVATPVASFLLVSLLGHPARMGLTVGAGLGQIGEFAFIVASLALTLGLLPAGGFQLVVASSVASIALNPALLAAGDRLASRIARNARITARFERRSASLAKLEPVPAAEPVRGHAIICGYGRVGRLVGMALERRGFGYIVITDDRHEVERLRKAGWPALFGDAANPDLLTEAHLDTANVLVVTVPNAHTVRLVIERARELNPRIAVVARTHSEPEAEHLRALGGNIQIVHAELELAVQMTRYALRRFGLSTNEAEAIAQGLRSRGGRPWAAIRPLSTRR